MAGILEQTPTQRISLAAPKATARIEAMARSSSERSQTSTIACFLIPPFFPSFLFPLSVLDSGHHLDQVLPQTRAEVLVRNNLGDWKEACPSPVV